MELGDGDNGGTSQPDLLNFERRLLEALHELNLKRRLLTECREELEKTVWKQHELEHTLETERRESQALHLQLEMAVGAVHRCGEERSTALPELSRLRIELEATKRERDCLKEQTHTTKLENLTLSRKVEELQGQLRCQQLFQENSINMQSKERTALEEIKSEVQKLIQDHKRLERTFEAAKMMGEQLQQDHTRYHYQLKKAAEERSKHDNEMVALRAQLDRLKLENKTAPADIQDKQTNVKTQNYLKELKEFVASESEGSKQLTEALEKAVQCQASLQKLEQEARENLNTQREQNAHLSVMNKTLNKSLEEAQETIRLLEEKEHRKKSVLTEQGTQMDLIEIGEHGTQTDMDTVTTEGAENVASREQSITVQDNIVNSSKLNNICNEQNASSESTKKVGIRGKSL